MKAGDKILKMMAAAMMIAGAAAACAKVEVNPVEHEEGAKIAYQAVIAKNKPDASTRAAIEGAAYPTDVPFRSVAYWNNGIDTDADGNTDTRAAAMEWVPESEITYQDPYWTTNNVYYWPIGGYLTFLAYSPASVGTTPMTSYLSMDKEGIKTLENVIWDTGQELKQHEAGEAEIGFDADGDDNITNDEIIMKNLPEADQSAGNHFGVDFMVADLKTNMTANGANGGYVGVPTVFNHMLSNITVWGKVEGNVRVVVKRVLFTDVYTQAEFSVGIASEAGDNWGNLNTNNPWKNHSEPEPVLIYKNETGQEMVWNTYSQIGESYIAIPQKIGPIKKEDDGKVVLSNIYLVVDYETYTPVLNEDGSEMTQYTETTKTIRLDKDFHGTENAVWERSKKYNYRLSFGEHQVIDFEGFSEAWTETQGGVLK